MTRRAFDDRQGDLLGWHPPEIVTRFEDRRILAVTWRDKVARAVSEVLKAHEDDREIVAGTMTSILGEPVSRSMLDQYASQAAEAHTIPFHRVIALTMATNDRRLLQLAAEACSWAVIDERYLGAVEAEIASDKIEELEAQRKLARRRWKGDRR